MTLANNQEASLWMHSLATIQQKKDLSELFCAAEDYPGAAMRQQIPQSMV